MIGMALSSNTDPVYNAAMTRQTVKVRFLTPVFALIVMLAAGGGFYVSSNQAQPERPAIEGLYWPDPMRLGPFSTLDQAGRAFGLERLRGKWSLVFFGYTHCPDICPITMAVMADAYAALQDTGEAVQTLFVTVDPERDTPAKLAQYVGYFNAQFIGLGGSLDMINGLTRQIGVPYYHGKKDGAGNYLVDHSASIFLLDPEGRLVAKFSAPHQKAQLVQKFTQITGFINAQS